jgi:hypothetical protein
MHHFLLPLTLPTCQPSVTLLPVPPKIVAQLANNLGTSALTVKRVGTLVKSAGCLTSSVQAEGTARLGQRVTVNTLMPMVGPLILNTRR